MALVIHIDGGARGNPGPAGAGVVIRSTHDRQCYEAGFFLGKQTNNAAEYHALIHALRRVVETRCKGDVSIHSDSELLVRQIAGEYRVKSPSLAKLHAQAEQLLLKLESWTIRHIRREENQRADELANMAMDNERDVIVKQVDAPPTEAHADTPSRAGSDPVQAAAAAADGSAAAQPERIVHGERRAVRVRVQQPSTPEACPVGGCALDTFIVRCTLPHPLCLHAAHAIVPTILAVQNTQASEFPTIPTLTVRCSHAPCDAAFQISPLVSTNGEDPDK